MFWNKVAGAILITAIAAMVVSKVGNMLLPPVHVGDTAVDTRRAPERVPPWNEAIATADLEFGREQIAKCTACHTLDKGGSNAPAGPNLWNVLGREKGGVAEFGRYSSAMRNADGTWDYETLYRFLENPQSVVSGTSMVSPLRGWRQVGSVVAYLRTLHDNPPPLPEHWKPEEEGEKKENGNGGADPAVKEDPAGENDAPEREQPREEAPAPAPAPDTPDADDGNGGDDGNNGEDDE